MVEVLYFYRVIALKQGYHPIEVQYFDHGGGSINLKVCGNDGKEIPFTYLYAH